MEHYVILHNQVPHYVHRDPCYVAMAKYVALHNATYLAIATVFWTGKSGITDVIRSNIHAFFQLISNLVFYVAFNQNSAMPNNSPWSCMYKVYGVSPILAYYIS